MNNSKILSIISALAFAALMSIGAAAQSTTPSRNPVPGSTPMTQNGSQTSSNPSSQQSSNPLDQKDEHFVTKAAEGNIAQMELGKLALKKGTSPEVRDFAQRMVTDHSQANGELRALAQSKGMTLPNKPSAQQQKQYDRLAKLSGPQFESAYINDMNKDHSKDVSEYKQEQSVAQDDAVKNYIRQTLPVIENHLQRAENLADKSLTSRNSQSSSNNPPKQ